MKKNYLLSILVAVLFFCISIQAYADYYLQVDGINYSNGQTAQISCSKTSVDVHLTVNPVLDINTTWDHSSNFSITESDVQTYITLNLDPNSGDGYITIHAGIGSGSSTSTDITVYITQTPPTPSFSSTPSLCTTSQSATYSVSFPTSGPNYPAGIYWQTTNGLTINGSSAGDIQI